MSGHTQEPLKVVAVVKFNDGEALIFNRKIKFVYKKIGMDYIGVDGPLKDVLRYSRGSGNFVAFAGRPICVEMQDGSVETLKDHWWSGSINGGVQVIYGDVDSLVKCYVMSAAVMEKDEYNKLRGTYTGCIYPYWDYKKIINFEKMRADLTKEICHETRRRKALVKAIKQMAKGETNA